MKTNTGDDRDVVQQASPLPTNIVALDEHNLDADRQSKDGLVRPDRLWNLKLSSKSGGSLDPRDQQPLSPRSTLSHDNNQPPTGSIEPLKDEATEPRISSSIFKRPSSRLSAKPSVASLTVFKDLPIAGGPFSPQYPLGYPSWLEYTAEVLEIWESSPEPRFALNRNSVERPALSPKPSLVSILSEAPPKSPRRQVSRSFFNNSQHQPYPFYTGQYRSVKTSQPPAFATYDQSYKVHPKDIKLIACLGDSLLTGLCLTGQPDTIKNRMISIISDYKILNPWLPWFLSGEHRQNNCISGGGHGVVSVGRLIRHHAPDVVGLNSSKTGTLSYGSGFNFAQSGATSTYLESQVRRLVKKIGTSKEAIPKRDGWTLVFIWIGANDIFMLPKSKIEESFLPCLLRAVQALKSSIFKCFVCILTLPDLSNSHPASKTHKEAVKERVKWLNEKIYSIETDYDWNADSVEFKLSVQPVPDDDLTRAEYEGLISTLDHAHPSIQAHQVFAKCIWNNMFRANSSKLTKFVEVAKSEWKFPGPNDYFA
jgi:lysophospholipase L1-like esterase